MKANANWFTRQYVKVSGSQVFVQDMIVALSIRKKWARGLIQETDMETQKIEARIKMDVIINNTKGAPVMGIEPIELIETIDVIINNTKGIPVIGIETT